MMFGHAAQNKTESLRVHVYIFAYYNITGPHKLQTKRGSRMNLEHALGNTFYLPLWQLIPIYKTDPHHCILLDTGLLEQRAYLEEALHRAGLTPVGILCTHLHIDHAANCRYFQEKYHIPVALPAREAALGCGDLNLKAYFYPMSPGQARHDPQTAAMRFTPDILIPPGADAVTVAGVPFGVLPTPGHSPGHVCFRTPDDVLYLGDAMMTPEEARAAKMPYFFSIQAALNSMEHLARLPAAPALAAHRGETDDLPAAAAATRESVLRCAGRIWALAETPVTLETLYAGICRELKLLTGNVIKAGVFQRTVRTYVEYLLDTGALAVSARDSMLYYHQAGPVQ